jgi:hypothetical protein
MASQRWRELSRYAACDVCPCLLPAVLTLSVLSRSSWPTDCSSSMCPAQASLPTYVGCVFAAYAAIAPLLLTRSRANAPHGELPKASVDKGRCSRVNVPHGTQGNQVVS